MLFLLFLILFLLQSLYFLPVLFSFPTRRSSDLVDPLFDLVIQMYHMKKATVRDLRNQFNRISKWLEAGETDRKSTRLNSSHEWISYAVFCLKKKICISMRYLNILHVDLAVYVLR